MDQGRNQSCARSPQTLLHASDASINPTSPFQGQMAWGESSRGPSHMMMTFISEGQPAVNACKSTHPQPPSGWANTHWTRLIPFGPLHSPPRTAPGARVCLLA